jgi:hypothetical protein
MKTWILVFAIAIGLTAILVVAVSWTARPPDQSVDHPEFAGMQQSGSDAVPDAGLLWIGWSFGALQIAFFAAMLALGARSRRGLRGLGGPLIFSVYYVVGFDRWIATPEDLPELDRTLERLRAEPKMQDDEIRR